jgi:YgiT-type zinc finger domain-containing protein
MTCVICKRGTSHPGKATITLERAQTTVIVKGVPALVCDNCGEEYVNEATSRRLLGIVEAAAEGGVQVDVREFVAA